MNNDEDIIGSDGRILHFSLERFKRDIVEGNCCFICGASPSAKTFNDEHVIPDWILKKYNLYSQSITLPNSTQFKYNNYKVPCCLECNAELGDKFEKPISEIIKKGTAAILDQMNKDSGKLFIKWLSLIYFKTHLKDRNIRLFQNKQKGNQMVGDFHFWNNFHYIHSFIRTFHTGVIIDPKSYGSFLVLPAKNSPFPYDYSDSSYGNGVYIRLGAVFLVYLFNDCCIVSDVIEKLGAFKMIEAELSHWQMREFFAHALKINMQIKNRPKFYLQRNQLLLSVEKPYEVNFDEEHQKYFRKICKGLFYVDMKDGRLSRSIYENLCNGNFSFIFDENGKFVRE